MSNEHLLSITVLLKPAIGLPVQGPPRDSKMENINTVYTGIWIDRRKAHIVYLNNHMPSEKKYEQNAETIDSQVEPRVRLSGGSRTRRTPWGPQDVAVDGKSAARRKIQLQAFFQSVIEKISRADRIYIMGPGETKNQLKNAIDKNQSLSGKIIMVETVDKLTLRQIAAKVRSFYAIEDVVSTIKK